MAPRSVTIQLAPGIGYATLPDHRRMSPGIQYEVDWDTFSKISPQARQSFISVVSVAGDVSTTLPTQILPDQTSNAVPQLGIWNLLTTSSATPVINTGGLNLSGKGFQGWTAVQTPSAMVNSTNFISATVTGPQDERYTYIYNASGSTAINAGDVVVWASNGSASRQVQSVHVANASINFTSGYGVFAGVATAAIPANYYGWIQIEGECPQVNVNSAVNTVGMSLYPDPSNTGYATTSAGVFFATTDITTGVPVTKPAVPFATALTAASSNKCAAHIRSFKSKVPYKRVYNNN